MELVAVGFAGFVVLWAGENLRVDHSDAASGVGNPATFTDDPTGRSMWTLRFGASNGALYRDGVELVTWTPVEAWAQTQAFAIGCDVTTAESGILFPTTMYLHEPIIATGEYTDAALEAWGATWRAAEWGAVAHPLA